MDAEVEDPLEHRRDELRRIVYGTRGEPSAGQYAVAEVTMNRKASRHYPKTVCDVVYQKEAFSWTELGVLEPPTGTAWVRGSLAPGVAAPPEAG